MASKGLYDLLINLQANTAKLQQDMDKAVGILQRSGRTMSNVMQGIGQGIGQALGRDIIANIQRLSTALTDLAAKGDKAGAILDNFRELGGSAAGIQAAQRAVLGTVDAFQLMRAANEGLAKGIPKLNENFATMAEFANRFADATGQETVPVLNQLIDALGSGAPKALAQFGFKLEEGATKAQNQTAAISQLNDVMGRLAPLGESVTQAHESFTAALSEAIQQVGIGINENQKLAGVYEGLAESVRSVDWSQFGRDFATIITEIKTGIPVLDELRNTLLGLLNISKLPQDIANIAEVAAGNTIRAQIVQLESYKSQLQAQLESAQKTRGNFTTGSERLAEIARLEREMAQTQTTIDRLLQQGKREAEFPQGGVGSSQNLPNPSTQGLIYWKGKWVPRSSVGEDSSTTDTALKKKHDKELKLQEDLYQEKSKQAAALLQGEYNARKRMEEDLARQREESVQTFANVFQGVFASLGLDPQMAAAASDIASNIAAGLFSDLRENQGGFFGLGQTIAQGLGSGIAAMFGGSTNMSTAEAHAAGIQGPGGADGSFMTAGGSFLGAGMTTDEAHAAGIQGPGMENGSFGGGGASGASMAGYAGWFQAGMQAAQDLSTVNKRDRDAKDNRAWGSTAGGIAGAAIFGAFTMGLAAPLGYAIGSAVGGIIGKFIPRGAQNPDTIARHQFANWMEDHLKEVGGLPVYENGRFRRLTNFIEGSSGRFNNPDWGRELTGKPNAGAFTGLGEGLRRQLGIKQDVGGQIGAMLFENLGGDIDNLRMAVKRLGLSFEDIQEAMLEAGRTGEKTWLEVEVGLQGVGEAFKDGLAGIGDYNKAMQMLLDSGGRGFEAIQSVRNIAIEAKEAGIKNFQELREHLLKTFDPETVDIFLQALEQRGVKTMEQLAQLDDRTAGGVVADMDAAGAKFKETAAVLDGSTKEVKGSIVDATSAIRELSASIRGVKYEPPAAEDNLDTDVAAASGAMVFGPTRALMGENGPEAILPVTRKNGKLGVSLHGVGGQGGGGGYVIHIDARGAAPGVEHQIRRAMREAEDRAVRRMSRNLDRAGRRA